MNYKDLLEIADVETEVIKEDSEKGGDFAIGIDLGTTNSFVACASHGKVEIIEDENQNRSLTFCCFI